jgi:hypothetical protein
MKHLMEAQHFPGYMCARFGRFESNTAYTLLCDLLSQLTHDLECCKSCIQDLILFKPRPCRLLKLWLLNTPIMCNACSTLAASILVQLFSLFCSESPKSELIKRTGLFNQLYLLVGLQTD